MQYIKYGIDHFDKSLFTPVKNRCTPWVKPEHGTGFWASSVSAECGWKDWCKREEFEYDFTKSVTFALTDNARICHIDSIYALHRLPEHIDSKDMDFWSSSYCIDFEEAAKKYDAIELHLFNHDHYDSDLYYALYGWDCDSILIMNPDVIKVEGGVLA